ncbi:hypothetical protein [Frankia sp. KB5]|uniref:hypothetical protein n=1 Tax=Frankia sp. KB5 TaxID=683318 RepID=UPI000A119AE1|nr:hypothetical protein [Frankia sp. KB5]ORT48410.1 hypothetical protein KBI5_15765 [Frankia sp. KB5]
MIPIRAASPPFDLRGTGAQIGAPVPGWFQAFKEHWIDGDPGGMTQERIDELNAILRRAQENPSGAEARQMRAVARRREIEAAARSAFLRLFSDGNARLTEDHLRDAEAEAATLDPDIDGMDRAVALYLVDLVRERLASQSETDARRTEFASRLGEIDAKFDRLDAEAAKAVAAAREALAEAGRRLEARRDHLADVRRSMVEKGIPVEDLGRADVDPRAVLSALAGGRRPATLPARIADALGPVTWVRGRARHDPLAPLPRARRADPDAPVERGVRI